MNQLHTKLFAGGIPTATDVKVLRDKFPNPKAGDTFSYAEIEKLILVKRDSNRFRSVVEAWRKALRRELNVLLLAIPNEGFRVMTGDERAQYSAFKYNGGIRRVRNAAAVATTTDRSGVSADGLRTLDHITQRAGVVQLADATEAKRIKFSLT